MSTMASRSVYEYMGNKRWLQSAEREAQGQAVIPGCEAKAEALDLDERYTLKPTLEWCKRVAGVTAYDLDVAACEESHHAPKWYGLEQDGLKQPWFGHVWCNPPYSDIEPWVKRAWQEWVDMETSTISMLLPACRTEQPWWQEHVEGRRDNGRALTTHFVPGRQSFGIPGNPRGIGVGSPPFGVVLLLWK